MSQYILPFFISLILSFILTPLVRILAFKIGAVDVPKDDRRIHEKPMPLIGGLAIYISMVIVSLIFLPLDRVLASIILGSSVIIIAGIIDDTKGMSPKLKLLFQIVAGLILISGGIKVDFVTNPFSKTNVLFYLKWFSIPVTLFWIVGITNTLNLIDGLDGLASGVAGISSISLMLVAAKFGYTNTIILSAIIAGGCLGFLPYNFNPAKIFMGDTGSLFLGFMLAVISIEGVMKSVAAIAIVVPILILGVPIFDTTFAIFRRVLSGKSILSADKGHLHHRLLDKGFSQRKTVLILYGISGVFGIFAVIIAKVNSKQAIYLSVLLLVVSLIIAVKIGLFKKPKR